MKEKLKIGDWVLFDLHNGNGKKMLGTVVEFDNDGDPGILPHQESLTHRSWFRYRTEVTKLSEGEVMLYILENS